MAKGKKEQPAKEQGKLSPLYRFAAVVSVLLVVPACIILLISDSSAYFRQAFSRHETAINALGTDPMQDFGRFREVQDMMHGRRDSLDPGYFSVADQIHMQDVQTLTDQVKLLTAASALFLASYLYQSWHRQQFWQELKTIMQQALAALTLISLIALLLFDHVFRLFHQVLFTSNTHWQLDPATSRLIRFLPQDIFLEIVLTGIAATFLLLAVVYGFAIIRQWKNQGTK